ncbi:hypothetical protein [uncultured Pseudoalteromonas sp.]|uniref:hypothetical protein n=1 Tax=uncultured Pseudoalteromonas sp. TaxID=114053 RepID=UPI002591A726|nr:hypothetical protein [uncultured Pseudoalteromonas sp.]
MKAQHLALVIGLTFTAFASQANASQVSDDKAAFSDAYQSYLTAVKKDENIEQAAKHAYTTGLALYGDKSDNTASLAINYAKAITAPRSINDKKMYQSNASNFTRKPIQYWQITTVKMQ